MDLNAADILEIKMFAYTSYGQAKSRFHLRDLAPSRLVDDTNHSMDTQAQMRQRLHKRVNLVSAYPWFLGTLRGSEFSFFWTNLDHSNNHHLI